MKVDYKAPVNGGSLIYCPHCGDEMERYKETTIKYCLECQRGFAIYSGASTGTIGMFQMTQVDLIAGDMVRIERDD